MYHLLFFVKLREKKKRCCTFPSVKASQHHALVSITTAVIPASFSKHCSQLNSHSHFPPNQKRNNVCIGVIRAVSFLIRIRTTATACFCLFSMKLYFLVLINWLTKKRRTCTSRKISPQCWAVFNLRSFLLFLKGGQVQQLSKQAAFRPACNSSLFAFHVFLKKHCVSAPFSPEKEPVFLSSNFVNVQALLTSVSCIDLSGCKNKNPWGFMLSEGLDHF